MRGPYGLEVIDDCQKCQLRGQGFFCQLPPTALKDLNAIKFTSAYPKSAILFMEKQAPRGIYVLCQGEMKLSVSSSEGKTLILRIARPGEVTARGIPQGEYDLSKFKRIDVDNQTPTGFSLDPLREIGSVFSGYTDETVLSLPGDDLGRRRGCRGWFCCSGGRLGGGGWGRRGRRRRW